MIMRKKAADVGTTVSWATAFNTEHTSFQKHSSGTTCADPARRPPQGHASCVLHSDNLKALSWPPSGRAGQWLFMSTSRRWDEGTQVLTCFHMCNPSNLQISLR